MAEEINRKMWNKKHETVANLISHNFLVRRKQTLSNYLYNKKIVEYIYLS